MELNETVTFTSIDSRFIFTVEKEFTNICPNYLKVSNVDLFIKFKINRYLHNTNGPAMVRIYDNKDEHWINGKVVTK